ncbi:SpoIIE family protein phosphatase [Methylobacter sp. YRD-M1]|uniref:SpoIIE family protein phosphatase n=1 Tax=Methylobacter sp. YRD-M1 TaxID=2911520 RepID=UPI00227D0C44|nr:SpoIIE family protein phosphatase [Methylobacter sp. YRD-M1]WAK03767.1 SpoIIE family protein phosphatase [Methylobacter sp. YRD-M1]
MQQTFRRVITYLLNQYITVLSVLALVNCLTYFVLTTDLLEQEGNIALVKLSSDQSRLVSDINFLTLQLNHVTDPAKITAIRSQILNDQVLLRDTLATLENGDRFIRRGDKLVREKSVLPNELNAIFFDEPIELSRQINNYLEASKIIVNASAKKEELDQAALFRLHSELAPDVLEGIEKATSTYQKLGEHKLRNTMSLQNIIFLIALGTLGLVGSVLLRPLILKLKETTFKIQEEKNFADNVINTAEALIIGLDPAGKVTLFNHYAEESIGWDEEEIKGEDFFEQFIPAHEQEILKQLFDGMMDGSIEFAEEVETQMIIRSGEHINIVWHTTVVHESRTRHPIMFLATGLDITERKQQELQLQQTHAELEQMSARLKGEVDLAATLQRSILPNPIIQLPGIQGKANLLTSSEVGGDYYDYYVVDGHKTVLLVGDVSGHGVAAGTMVSAAKAGVYPLVHAGVSNPAEILQSLNETMLATAHQSLLMTMACITLDAVTGKLTFANAGHVLPYLWRRQEQRWEILEASGLPLGKSIDSDYFTPSIELQMEIGDRIFMFTDGLVEEESPEGEAFGYDRLENLLNHCGEVEPEIFHSRLMGALNQHCEGRAFTDDITILVINHSDRVMPVATSVEEASDIIRLSDTFYRRGDHPIPRISREYVVFFAEQEYADLLSRFSQDGICRVLPRNNKICVDIGWEKLLNQHHYSVNDDLYTLLPASPLRKQFQLTHTEDKLFIMEEVQAWLTDQQLIPEEHLESLIVALDEMIENSLYAAPRDGKGIPYYQKGVSRELSEHEEVRIDIVLTDKHMGLMVTDNWGTLTPAVFLKSISHAMNSGVEAGIGGAGLYMLWRLSDYFQIRILPQQKTQVTTLWDLGNPVNMDTSSGFQFLYHSKYDAENKVGA